MPDRHEAGRDQSREPETDLIERRDKAVQQVGVMDEVAQGDRTTVVRTLGQGSEQPGVGSVEPWMRAGLFIRDVGHACRLDT